MKNKIITSLLMIAIAIALAGIVLGQSTTNVCCEKTNNGAWCQNTFESNCNMNFKFAPTNCDATSYCKKGCCFDSTEGICLESTSQRVCEDSNGTWADSPNCDIKQCQLGCCVLADQGAFVTFTRCKQMSGFYGVATDFRPTITNEVECIATASLEDKGACVTEDTHGALTCQFTTRANCPHRSGNLSVVNATSNQSRAGEGFYKDYLCTAEELGTECARTTRTTLISGKDEVYYLDTCGNIANIYDASKVDDNNYWKKVYKKEDSCGYGSSNAGSSSCGNCDYYLGSYGVKAKRGTSTPTYGNYICKDLNCKTEGKKHGESWCKGDSPSGNGEDPVGSKYYREICLFGEVITEPCAEFRNQVCVEGDFNGFTEAQCRTNRWQDCTGQLEQADCENRDLRECIWRQGYYFSGTTAGIMRSTNDTNGDGKTDDPTPKGLCLPNYPPGLQFWTSSSLSSSNFSNPTTSNSFNNSGLGTGAVSTTSGVSSASSTCSQASTNVVIKWTRTTKPLAFWESKGGWECANDECFSYVNANEQGDASISDASIQALADDMNQICYRVGDCGGYVNWVGVETSDGYAAYYNNERKAGAGGAEVLTAKKTTTTNGTAGTTAIGASIAVDLIKANFRM